jgi:hypothetical protein
VTAAKLGFRIVDQRLHVFGHCHRLTLSPFAINSLPPTEAYHRLDALSTPYSKEGCLRSLLCCIDVRRVL